MTYDVLSLWRLLRLPSHDMVIAFTSPPLAGLHGALGARLWRARFVHWLMNINHEMAMEIGYVRRKSLLGRVLTAIYRFTLRTCDLGRRDGPLDEIAGGTRGRRRPSKHRHRPTLAYHTRRG